MIAATGLGVVPDAGDQLASLSAALTRAAGRTLYLPRGKYPIDLAVNPKIVPSAGTRVVGDGRDTVIELFNASATKNLFNILTDDVQFENISFKIDPLTAASGAAVQIFRPGGGAQNFSLRNVNINGGVVAGSSYVVFVISPVGTQDNDFAGIEVYGGHYKNLTRMYHRANSPTQTAVVRSLRFSRSRYEGFAKSVITINSPHSHTVDLLIEGNSFADQIDEAFLSIGGGKRVRVLTNDFVGAAREVIHLEESVESAVLAMNTVDLSSPNAVAVFVTDNNIGGGQYIAPRNIAINANIMRGPGKASAASRGILLVNDATGTKPADGVIATDNIIEGFGRAISATDGTTNPLFVWNIVRENGIGMWSLQPIPRSSDNLYVGNDEDIHVEQS